MSYMIPKISAIITTYNAQSTIQRTINSLNNQEGINDLFNLEIIIIDDCSIDNTTNIITENKLDYISTNKNTGGPNKGRNIGLKKSTGNYICIVDHDDEWHPNKLKTILPFLEKAPIITSGYINKDLKNNRESIITNTPSSNNYLFFDKNSTFLNKLLRNGKGQNTYLGSIIYSSKLKHIEFEETYGMVDYDWLLRLFHEQTSIEICQPLYTRYVEGINLSLNETYRLNDYNYSIQFVKSLQSNYPKEVASSIKKINGSLARYYYLTNKMSQARKYFLKSNINLKTVFYIITTFVGAKIVKRYFNVFG